MRHTRIAAALLALTASLLASIAALGHGNEDHGKDTKVQATAAGGAPPASNANEAPMRLPDGDLFVPKAVQRQLGIRTVRVEGGELSVGTELNGRVIAQPGAGGRVQATQAGSVVPAGKAFPQPGQRVRRGQRLADLLPIVGSLELAGQRAQQAELAALVTLAERRVARLEQLEGSVPAKDIESARIELQALQQRRVAIGAAVGVAQPLRAPVDGVVSAVHVVAGEVVDARALLFEIVDPTRLAVEALAYDNGLVARIVDAEALAGERRIPLQLIGAGLQLREQALPLQFRVLGGDVPLAIGQPVKVFARLSTTAQGMAVPRAALWRSAAGGSQVWVHERAERFSPRRVRAQPLDARSVLVGEPLQPGDRVVVEGAALLAQIR